MEKEEDFNNDLESKGSDLSGFQSKSYQIARRNRIKRALSIKKWKCTTTPVESTGLINPNNSFWTLFWRQSCTFYGKYSNFVCWKGIKWNKIYHWFQRKIHYFCHVATNMLQLVNPCCHTTAGTKNPVKSGPLVYAVSFRPYKVPRVVTLLESLMKYNIIYYICNIYYTAKYLQ